MPDALNQTAAAGDGSVRYFLMVEGLDGGSTARGFEAAFDVSSAALGIANESGLRTEFGDLELTLASGSNSDELMRILATGQHIAKAQLVAARQNAKGEWEAVNDYRFADVQLSHFGFSQSGRSTLSLAYDAIQQTVGGETFGWDVGGSQALGQPIGLPNTPVEDTVPQFRDVAWFLTVEGLDGGGPNGAFRISGFDFAMSHPGASGSGGGAGSGTPSFDPLAIRLELGSAAEEILEWLASGRVVRAAQIVGLTEDGEGKTAYDFRMADVLFTAAKVHGGKEDQIGLNFGAFSLTTIGAKDAAETFSYNIKDGIAGSVALAAPVAAAEAGLNGGKPSWHMVIDGLNGGGREDGLFGAFDVVDFSFGGLHLPPAGGGGGGGGGAGKVAFDALTVTFKAGSALDELFDLLATGRHLDHGLRISGDVAAGGRTFANAHDLRLNDVQVTGISQLKNGNVAVTIDFDRYSLTTAGKDGTRETSGWDLSDGTRLSSELTAAEGAKEAWSAGPGKNTDYYLVIEGLDGGADAKGMALAFEVASFQFGAAVTSSSGGGGAGKAEFGPLSLKLDLGSAAAQLLGRWGDEAAFSVQLVGREGSGKGHVVYDLRLGEATVTGLGQAGKGLDLLSLDYGQFSIATGRGKAREAFGFDLGDNTPIGELDAARGADQSARAGHAMNYLLVIDGLDGGGPKGAFRLDDFDFALERTDDGRAHGLTVSLDAGSATDELMALIARGTHVQLARLIGNETGKKGLAEAYDLRLEDLVVTGFEQNLKGKDVLSFAFDAFSLSTKNDKGKVTTEGFDFGSNTDAGLLLPAKGGRENGQAGKPMDYWLVIDGLNSGGKARGHEGAFRLDGFDLGISSSFTGGGGGGGTGRVTFDPLAIFLKAGVAADELMELIATGRFVSSVSIVGETKGKKAETHIEIRLEDVQISELDLENGKDGLAMTYDAISLTSWDAKGRQETYGFDIAGNRDLDHVIVPPVVGEL